MRTIELTMVTKKKKMRDNSQLLRTVIQSWLGIKDSDYASHDITNTLTHAGITHLMEHFTMLTEEDIDALMIPATTRNSSAQPLSIINKRLLKAILSFYHTLSRAKGEPYNVGKVKREVFQAFKITEYDPSATIVPRFVKKRKSEDPDIANWKKAIRPAKSDFKDLKDDAHWGLHREHVKTTLKSQGLLHLIDEKFVPSKQDLDKLQQNWLYKIFQDTLKTPGTKSVVKAHLGDMDTCKIWADKKGENVVVK